MPVQTMQSIAEHQLFKATLPLLFVFVVGSITWIFVTVMDIYKVIHKIEDSEIPQINKDIALGYKKIEELEKQMMDMRIKMAEIEGSVSPGHPSKSGFRPENR